ncbi:SDR family NAD(P)-dependent oxidoreductase [Nocardiopsis suaedae]|uniref:SDR family NAD(P)-dependent oxidoreductase n=1 Tax=Nocardiopsis suaedae TaxID=3018444 RepID=A0ABT4TL12_9ACTN|nr:SDR family NAD(P)-dependent oxidoreductase [Nocardiopsis suaedae]MDA2805372.1 SDR family NAD(P)-dependent oxidoreductase [Nocardiopsis suaedae]
MLLRGKTALITGASRGIGAAAARAFAAEGASVALAARDAEALERVVASVADGPGEALAVPTDVTDEAAVRRLVKTVTEHFGGLHLAFNNAGGAGDAGMRKAPVDEIPTRAFDSAVELNLRSVYLCLMYEAPAIMESGGGAIVNTSSGAGLAGGVPGIAPYVSAKHGLQGLTKAAALDYAARGVRVNAVAPGPVLTDLMAQAPEEYREAAAAAVPMGRVGRPEEVAAAAVWLCSDRSAFVTGATLPVDGGQAVATA